MWWLGGVFIFKKFAPFIKHLHFTWSAFIILRRQLKKYRQQVASPFTDDLGRRRQSQGVVEWRVSRSGHCECKLLSMSQAHKKGGRKEGNWKQTACSPARQAGRQAGILCHSVLALAFPSPEDAFLQTWACLTRSPRFSLCSNATFPLKPISKSQRSFLPLPWPYVLSVLRSWFLTFYIIFTFYCSLSVSSTKL